MLVEYTTLMQYNLGLNKKAILLELNYERIFRKYHRCGWLVEL